MKKTKKQYKTGDVVVVKKFGILKQLATINKVLIENDEDSVYEVFITNGNPNASKTLMTHSEIVGYLGHLERKVLGCQVNIFLGSFGLFGRKKGTGLVTFVNENLTVLQVQALIDGEKTVRMVTVLAHEVYKTFLV